MKSRLIILLGIAFLASLLPQVAQAEDGDDHGFLMQVDGPVRVEPNETVGTVLVIDGDVTIDGTVDGTLILIDGRTVINGTVTGDIVAIEGRLELGPDAVVDGDIAYNETEFRADPNATVRGELRDNLGASFDRDFARALAWIVAFSWVVTTIFLVLAGLAFAGIGGRQLWGSAHLISRNPLQSVLAAVLLWFGLMVLAGGFFVTLVGIPISFVVLLVLLAMWALGYLVAGARIGAALIRDSTFEANAVRPYLQTVVGVLVIQAIALIPVLAALVYAYAGNWDTGDWSALNAILYFMYWSGAALVWVLGVLGMGALAYYAWKSWHGASVEGPTTQSTA